MPLIKLKPTSPGRRGVIKVVVTGLHKGKPFEPLLERKKKTGGRNSQGRITTRHIGGEHKRKYRFIDFKRDKDNIAAKVERIEYDPNRTAHIALILYKDGERRYIISPQGLKVGQTILSGPEAPIQIGNTLPLKNIPVGTQLHCIELRLGRGAQLARSAGTSAQLLGKDGGYVILRLRSGEMRKVLETCRATIGEVGNVESNLRVYGKAGAKRWLGIRPTVRGVAMNPIDHPHGGGEGKTSRGGPPRSPWGWKTKGLKTRKNKRTKNMIIKHRN